MSGSVFSIWFLLLLGIGLIAVAAIIFAIIYVIHYVTTKNKRNHDH